MPTGPTANGNCFMGSIFGFSRTTAPSPSANRNGTENVGHIRSADLVEKATATHVVATRGTHLYPVADLKSPEVMALSFGARLRIVSTQGAFFETHAGLFVPKCHLRPANAPFTEPASIAQLFFGTPYLWGGNSAAGIDCSGLIQAALLACGIPCPADSDLQESSIGKPLTDSSETLRGDLFFWQGHVAMAVDEQTFIHANAHRMSVAYEPIDTTIKRIAEQGGGPVTARKRL